MYAFFILKYKIYNKKAGKCENTMIFKIRKNVRKNFKKLLTKNKNECKICSTKANENSQNKNSNGGNYYEHI